MYNGLTHGSVWARPISLPVEYSSASPTFSWQMLLLLINPAFDIAVHCSSWLRIETSTHESDRMRGGGWRQRFQLPWWRGTEWERTGDYNKIWGSCFSAKWDGFKLLPVFTTHSGLGNLLLGGAVSWGFGNQKGKVCKWDLPSDVQAGKGKKKREKENEEWKEGGKEAFLICLSWTHF